MLAPAVAADAPAIAALRTEVAIQLTSTHGTGHWSAHVNAQAVRHAMGRGTVYVARDGAALLATVTLSTHKPWAIEARYFTPVGRPLYLTDMAVSVAHQRAGIGRRVMDVVRALAVAWPADAIRLDAYDAPAGAGPFYARCGYAERARVTYRRVGLVYYELLFAPAVAS